MNPRHFEARLETELAPGPSQPCRSSPGVFEEEERPVGVFAGNDVVAVELYALLVYRAIGRFDICCDLLLIPSTLNIVAVSICVKTNGGADHGGSRSSNNTQYPEQE